MNLLSFTSQDVAEQYTEDMKMIFHLRLLRILTSLFLLIQVVSVESCSYTAIKDYLEQRADATREVVSLLQNILAQRVPALNVTMNAGNITSLYSAVVSAYNKTESEEGLKGFKSAIDVISESYLVFCYGQKKDQYSKEDRTTAVKTFVERIADPTTDATTIQEDYGKVLCLQNLKSIQGNSDKQKRSSHILDCVSASTILALYDCLDPHDVWPCIFNIDPSSGDCPYNTQQSQPYNCLAFVVDTTGSMSQEIAAARNIINQFIQSEKNILTYCYVLVGFNDFLKQNYSENLELYKIYDAQYNSNDKNSHVHFSVSGGAVPVHSVNNLLIDVNNLQATGGYNCPEYGMIGILKAIELINSIDDPLVKTIGKHNIIVLTDASAEDDELYSYVIGNATDPNNAHITVHFFFSDCWCCEFSHYLNIATATCGFAVHSIDAQAFTQFADYLYEAQQSPEFGLEICKNINDNQVIYSSNSVNSSDESCYNFNISLFTSKFSLLVHSTSLNPVMKVIQPDGSDEDITINGDFIVYKKDHPQYGQWNACLSTGYIKDKSLDIVLELTFVMDYIEIDPQTQAFKPVLSAPFICDNAYFIINSHQLSKIDLNESLLLHLIHVNGTHILQTELTECAGVLFGSFTIPNVVSPVYYRIQGKDISSNSFKQIISETPITFFEATTILNATISKLIISPDAKSAFHFSVMNERKQPITMNMKSMLNIGNTTFHETPVSSVNVNSTNEAFEVTLEASDIDFNNLNTNQQLSWTLTVTDECSSHLYALTVPVIVAPAIAVFATNTCSADILLSWKAIDNIDNVLNYSVYLIFNNGTNKYIGIDTSPSSLNYLYYIEGLPHNETIQVIINVDFMGGILQSQPYTLWTNTDVPSSPSIVSAKEFESTTVLLGIQPPDCPNGKILNYVVYYRNDLKIDVWEQYIVESINGSFNQFVTAHIKHLSPGNTYGIKVAGKNAVGIGEVSQEFFVSLKALSNKVEVFTVSIAVSIPLFIVCIAINVIIVAFFIYTRRLKKKKKDVDKDDKPVMLSNIDENLEDGTFLSETK